MLDVSGLRDTLIRLNLTGPLNRNTPESNRQAIREMLARNDYWALEAEGLVDLNLTYDDAADIVAGELGMSRERFESNEPAYINPEHTLSRLITGFHRAESVAKHGGTILLSTAHPGSMLSFYQRLGDHFAALGGRLVRLKEPVPAPDRRWLDDVNGVIALSDEGNLMHTHASNGMKQFVENAKPDIVISDHAFAIAAMNAGYPTVAIFDVDDPAIPVLAHFKPAHNVAVPMNDNQTNSRTAQAATALIETLSHDRNPRTLHPRAASSA